MMNLEFNLEDAKRVWKNDGKIEGRMEEKEKVAEKLLRRGNSIEIVAEDTELTIEQVEKIAERINVSV